MPGGLRENGNTQDLIEVRSRVQVKVLEQWLDNRGIIERAAFTEQVFFEGFFSQRVESARMSTSAKQFLSGHYTEGTWDITLLKAACELFKLGSSWNEVVDSCTKITGHLDQRDLATLRSAQKTTPRPKRFRQSGHHQK